MRYIYHLSSLPVRFLALLFLASCSLHICKATLYHSYSLGERKAVAGLIPRNPAESRESRDSRDHYHPCRYYQRNLNLPLLIFKALIRVSSVDGGIPSLMAAPDGPATRPLVCASAATIISRSLRCSPSSLKSATFQPATRRDVSLESHNSSTEKTSPSSERRTSQLRSVIRGCCLASRKTATDRASSCRWRRYSSALVA